VSAAAGGAAGAAAGKDGKRALGGGAQRSFTFAEVAAHNTAESCWITMDGRVYDLTPWLDSHPGGREMLLLAAGRECTDLFRMYHWRVAGASGKPGRVEKMMQQLEVGVLAGPTGHPLFAPDTTGFYDELTAAVKGYFAATGERPKQRACSAESGERRACAVRARARGRASARAREQRMRRRRRIRACERAFGRECALEFRAGERVLRSTIEAQAHSSNRAGAAFQRPHACAARARRSPAFRSRWQRRRHLPQTRRSHNTSHTSLPPANPPPPSRAQCGRACGASCCRSPSGSRPSP